MSQAEPGWYPLPNKPGVMGRWTGTGWSGEEQPLPPTPSSQPILPDAPVGQPISYGGHPSQPFPVPGQFGPQSGAWTPSSIIETVKREAQNPNSQATGKQALGGAMIADGIVGFGEKRSGIFGAVGTIIFGIVWLLFTTFLLGGLTEGNKLKPGETTSQGKVIELNVSESTSKGKTSRMCSPVVEFTVNGAKHTASTNGSTSPCPWRVGQDAKVLYDPKSVDASSRVPMDGKGMDMFTKIFPLAGWLIIAGGVWTLLVRLGTIGAGIYFWRKGSQQKATIRRKPGQ